MVGDETNGKADEIRRSIGNEQMREQTRGCVRRLKNKKTNEAERTDSLKNN